MTKKNTEIIYEKLAAMHKGASCELTFSTAFELLVAVILSAQCTDKRVNVATEKLFKVYNTPQQFAQLSLDELKPYIFSCGFYNNKGKNILAMSKDILTRFGGEVPRTLDELVTLSGVGRKTASVVLCVAYGIPAMPVDTHVFRVSHRLGLSEANTPEGVEKDLCLLFPRENWHDLHHYMIFHGRYICHSQKPECEKCDLLNDCNYKNKERKGNE